MKTKLRVRRTIEANDVEEATPQASEVRNMKNARRYVKDGSGLCHVFLVSMQCKPST